MRIEINNIQNHLVGISFKEAPVFPDDQFAGLMAIKNGVAKYLYDRDDLIGLNLANTELTNEKWNQIVNDISPEKIQALNLSANDLQNLNISPAFSNLKWLEINNNTKLNSFSFGGEMPKLERLILRDNEALGQLSFIADFLSLEYLDVSRCKLEKIVFKKAITTLEFLDLSNNKLKGINFIGGFTNLKYLYLKDNKLLTNLSFKSPEPPLLNILNVMNCQLKRIPNEIIFLGRLEFLDARGNVPKNIPKIFLETRNCLKDARDWFTELRDYPFEKNRTVKLMLTGNGDAGKTTLLCALKNGECEHDHSSTHAIQIESWSDGEVSYNTWDFGGQEVYHGTHRLFMASEAVQVILFTPDVQKKARLNETVKDRIRDDNIIPHTVEYWFQTIKLQSPKSAFLIVQNKEDQFPEKDRIVDQYASRKAEFRMISAKEGNGIEHLKYFIRTAAKEMPDYEMVMPQSWLDVRQFFIDNLEKEENLKIIDQTFFESLCSKQKVSKRTWSLLKRYLHHTGYLYYHENLEDKIIADQKWALEAIYKPLDRKAKHYGELLEDKGKIRVRRLFEIFGDKYTQNEKWLFLKFLKSCGLCFKMNHRPELEGDHESDVYLFPEFLSMERPDIVTSEWEKMEEVHQFIYPLNWLNYHVVQNFITTIGRKTEIKYIWRTGIYVPTTQGNFKLELDVSNKTLVLSVEEKATAHWLEPILKELRDYTNLEHWQMRGTDGKYIPFTWELWNEKMQKRNVPILKIDKNADQKDSVKNLLRDTKQEYHGKDVLLFIAANPPETKKIGSQYTEFAKLHQAINGKLELASSFTTSPAEMNNEIAKWKPTVVHFCGHANTDSLEFHDASKRNSKPLDVSTLHEFFASIKNDFPKLKLVFLNACSTADIAKAISENKIYTIGTNDEIGSVKAISFAEGFYHQYVREDNIVLATRHGKRSCLLKTKDSDTLVELYFNGEKQTIEL